VMKNSVFSPEIDKITLTDSTLTKAADMFSFENRNRQTMLLNSKTSKGQSLAKITELSAEYEGTNTSLQIVNNSVYIDTHGIPDKANYYAVVVYHRTLSDIVHNVSNFNLIFSDYGHFQDLNRKLSLAGLFDQGGEYYIRLKIYEDNQWKTLIHENWEKMQRVYSGGGYFLVPLRSEYLKIGVMSSIRGVWDIKKLQAVLTQIEGIEMYCEGYVGNEASGSIGTIGFDPPKSSDPLDIHFEFQIHPTNFSCPLSALIPTTYVKSRHIGNYIETRSVNKDHNWYNDYFAFVQTTGLSLSIKDNTTYIPLNFVPTEISYNEYLSGYNAKLTLQEGGLNLNLPVTPKTLLSVSFSSGMAILQKGY